MTIPADVQYITNSSPSISPDGRFLMYVSNETGRDEVYITAFPEPGSKPRISREGGLQPRWRSDGGEVFYVSADGQLTAVELDLDSGFDAGVPKELFHVGPPGGSFRSNYAAAANGQRFVVLKRLAGARAQPLTVVLNWTAELAQ